MFDLYSFPLLFNSGDEVNRLGEVVYNFPHTAKLREDYSNLQCTFFPGVITSPYYSLGSYTLQIGSEVLNWLISISLGGAERRYSPLPASAGLHWSDNSLMALFIT